MVLSAWGTKPMGWHCLPFPPTELMGQDLGNGNSRELVLKVPHTEVKSFTPPQLPFSLIQSHGSGNYHLRP